MKKRSKLLDECTVYDELPEGWKFLKGAMTAPVGYEWASNGKSRFGGEYKQALIKIFDVEDYLNE